MPRQPWYNGPGAVALVEEAFFLLRSCAVRLLPGYLIGTVPFVAGFIWFWADMARHPLAQERAPLGALVLTVLFVWMRAWQALFSQRLLAEARAEPHAPLRPWHVVRMTIRQTFAHAVALMLLPVALVITLPFGWAYAFIHTFTILEDGSEPRMRDTLGRAWRQAREWPAQNHTIIWLCSPYLVLALVAMFTSAIPIATSLTPGWTNGLLALFAFFFYLLLLPTAPIGLLIALNFASGIYAVPFLLRTLFGVRTLLSDGGMSPFNTTFIIVVCGLTYLCLDPLMKGAYVMRVFYAEARVTGEDLRRRLRQIAAAAAPVALFAGVMLGSHATAEPATQGIDSAAIDRAVDAELDTGGYAWREVREHPLDTGDGPVARAARAIGRMVKKSLDAAGDALGWVGEKLMDLWEWVFGRRQGGGADAADSGSHFPILRTMMILLAVGCVVLLVYLGVRTWIQRDRTPDDDTFAFGKIVPDLRDETTLASDLPEDEWLRMARERMEQGDFRLAARALFLATLATLAERQMIRVARFKSNRDYGRELSRYHHERPTLLSHYSESMRAYEAVWYGDHPCTPDLCARLARNREAMTSHG